MLKLIKKYLRMLYPFTVALFPVFALWNFNLAYVDFNSAFRSIILTVLATAFVWLFFKAILKDWQKAGIITSFGMLLLFTYGHAYLLVKEDVPELARHRYLLALFAILFLGAGWIVIRKLKNVEGVELFLAITSLLLIGNSIFQISRYQYLSNKASRELIKNLGSDIEIQNPSDDFPLPDFYLIILDEYARADVLNEFYGYDNSPFLNELMDMGFYVSECSHSNYASTRLSLPSILNFNYLPEILGDAQALPSDSNRLQEILEQLGYTSISFESRARAHFRIDTDIHLARNPLLFENLDLLSGVTEFESMLMETTVLRVFFDSRGILPESLISQSKQSELYEHYLQTKYILDQLENLHEIDAPIFVFAHILVPHQPYIFTPTGEYKGYSGDVGYLNNLKFINSAILSVLRTIIDNSEDDTIIIVMGDHGTMGSTEKPERRLANLGTYYVNDETKALLYKDITPVNSIRIILNQYFGTDYPLLEDISYYNFKLKEFLEEGPIPMEIPCQTGWK